MAYALSVISGSKPSLTSSDERGLATTIMATAAPTSARLQLSFVLNGRQTAVHYEEGMHFLEVLREECGVTSPKDGCAPQGYCGCCAILVDGRPVLACRRKPEQMEGRAVVTLEGVPERTRACLPYPGDLYSPTEVDAR